MRLLLIRHGRSAHAMVRRALDRAAVEAWLAAYDEAGLAADDRPPPEVIADVARACVLATSDMPRARASAALLAPDRTVHTSPLFREEPLPLPSLAALRAPLVAWAFLTHLRWVVACARGTDAAPAARERAREAVRWCHDACDHGHDGTVAVVTHGVFRRLLARQLVRDGWRAEPGRRGYAHWSVWRFRLDAR